MRISNFLRTLAIAAIGAMAIFFVSCNPTDNGLDPAPRPEPEEPHTQERQLYETEDGTFKFSEGTIYLTDTGNGGVSIIDAYTLSVKKGSITDEQKAKVGDIYLYTRTGDNPQGLLGRVDSVSDDGDSWFFHTSPVNLDEVFDEIHLEGDLKLLGKDGTYLDENEETVSYSVVDNSIWDTLDEYEMIEEDSTTPTKSSAGTKGEIADGKGEQTFEFKIKAGNVEGTIYLGLGIYAKINKDEGGKLECNFTITTKIGAKASLTLKEVEKKIPFLTVKKMLPMDIVVGPLILTPEIVLEEGIKPFAKVSLESDLKMELFNTVFEAGHYDGAPHFSFGSGTKADSYFKVLSLEGSAGISLYNDIAIEIATYGIRDILSVGVEGSDECKFNFLEGNVSLTNKDLLELGLDVNIEKSKTVSAYVHSQAFKMFGAEDGKFSASTTFSTSAEMGILPEHVDNAARKINSGIKATANGVRRGLTAVAEHGFALFQNGIALEHRNLGGKASSTTKASGNELNAEFETPNDGSNYTVKEYVKVKNSDGEYYYYKDIEDILCPDENHIHAIDLGLSVKWACCNVGATRPEEYGGYYAWGETTEKSVYNQITYKYAHGIDTDGDNWYDWDDGNDWLYDNIGSDISGSQYDVAHVKWGGSWRMPTITEAGELINNCTSEWTNLNGIVGRKFTSKINGNSIFLPAAGYYSTSGLFDSGAGGSYWTSSIDSAVPISAYELYFIPCNVETNNTHRFYGQSVRPVSE